MVNIFCALFSLRAKTKLITSIGVQPFGCAMLHYMPDVELFSASPRISQTTVCVLYHMSKD